MASNLATPGIYVEEKSSFGTSVVPVSTAVPAFVGYTQKAARGTKSLTNKPTRISNFGEYVELFGGAPNTLFTITPPAKKTKPKAEGDGPAANAPSADTGSDNYTLEMDSATRYLMYDSIRLYFVNGGSGCYIVSVGNFESKVSAKDLNDIAVGGGIASLEKYTEPTILVVPEATLLSESDCYSIQATMLQHCGYKMKNRFAILDIYGGDAERTFDNEDVVTKFREGVGANYLSWGAAYYPSLNTTIVGSSEIDFTRIKNAKGLIDVLNAEVDDNLAADNISAARAQGIKAEIAKIATTTDSDLVKSLQSTLNVISPKLNSIMIDIADELNTLPPSPAIAGLYCMVDSSVNVAKSPANLSLGSVISPAVNINNENQEDLNLPLNGKAVNAIRSFAGKGTLVWGARTLEGNSKDYRYISVRRTMTFIEQSIKFAAESYVFSPNNATTWSSLRATVYNFLNNQWSSGILVGSTPQDAFDIQIGLGSTMTSTDILDGVLKMTIKVAIVRPAEFIVITFEQQQQKS